MSAKNGLPCKKCGGHEWYKWGGCVPCKKVSGREWHRNNREKSRASTRKWQSKNREKTLSANRMWRSNNLEKKRANALEWQRANPDKLRQYSSNRRTRKTQAGGSYTAAEFKQLCEQYGSRCLGCGRDDVKLTADHVVPVTKGGSSDISNIQPLCFSCNSRKHDKVADYRTKPGIARWIQNKLFG